MAALDAADWGPVPRAFLAATLKVWLAPVVNPVMICVALCLQLVNIISDGLPPRKCANDTCPNYFIRQQGRAQAGQHRSYGTEYCERACARAQAQREYRRRIVRAQASDRATDHGAQDLDLPTKGHQ